MVDWQGRDDCDGGVARKGLLWWWSGKEGMTVMVEWQGMGDCDGGVARKGLLWWWIGKEGIIVMVEWQGRDYCDGGLARKGLLWWWIGKEGMTVMVEWQGRNDCDGGVARKGWLWWWSGKEGMTVMVEWQGRDDCDGGVAFRKGLLCWWSGKEGIILMVQWQQRDYCDGGVARKGLLWWWSGKEGIIVMVEWHVVGRMVVMVDHRRTGWGGGIWPPKIRADTTFIRAKDNTFVWLTVSLNGTSIHLPEIRFGWGNKGDVHRVLLYDCQKIGTAIVHDYLFLPGGAAWKQFVFAIRAKLGLTPPPPNGCWPVRLWWWCGKCNNGMEGSRVEGRIISISDDCVASKDNIDDGAEL